jgi:zinc/manganese transport system permease protein
MTAPAAAARHMTHAVLRMVLFSIMFGVAGVWGGLILSYYTNAPVSFFITALECLFYFLALTWSTMRSKRKPRLQETVIPILEQV